VNNKDIEFLVHRIISGDQFFLHDNIRYLLTKPSLHLKLEADILYQDTYEDNLFNGFFLEEDLDYLLIEFDMASPFLKTDLANTEKSLSKSKMELFKNWIDIKKRKAYKKEIQNLKNKLTGLYNIKHSLDFLTLEHYCDNIKNQYVISRCLYRADSKEIVFASIESIEYGFFNSIMQTIANNVIDISSYKAIARHDYWRNYYNTNKFNVFNCSASELSEEQRALLNTSIMYDRIYEHPDCPEPDIIQDDDALDGWMLYQQEKNKAEKTKKGVDNMLSNKVKNSSEIFLMAQDKEQQENIWNLNSSESKARIQEKTQLVLNSTSEVQEHQLPDVQRDIRQKIAELNRKK
jgi:hypothetical protein